jgi:hypoxanthine phosphoribosyltransferase
MIPQAHPMDNIKLFDKEFEVYLSPAELSQITSDLGKRISTDYEGLNPILIAVLNGAFVFAADLIRAITIQSEITFVKVASYEATSSKGTVEEILGLEKDITGRHIIIVEDIVDTGLTMTELLKNFKEYYPASIEICSLLLKPESLKKPLDVKYVGMEIPPKFVVGYGLDFDGIGRNLPALYQLVTSDLALDNGQEIDHEEN